MWIQRDLSPLQVAKEALPVKILKGPRQVGKTSLLEKDIAESNIIRFDDQVTRRFAEDNPRFFLSQFKGRILIDEAPLVENIFLELKRRVDESRRNQDNTIDVWLTGSNQTLLRQGVRETLAGRASYFDLNTLSLHEIGSLDLNTHLLRGGWPELVANPKLSVTRYLNDFISTFIDRDIALAAGIEKKAAFSKILGLIAARQGMLVNFSEIASLSGVDVTTVQSWLLLLEENGVLRKIEPFGANRNHRLIKTPKFYFEDVGLACRLQGWTSPQPLMLSSLFGFHLECMVLTEISRFFSSRGETAKVFHLRNKEKVEIDFLVELPNQKYIAIEVKATPQPFSAKQIDMLNALGLGNESRWIVSPGAHSIGSAEVVALESLYAKLAEF
jgi:uncharacterized protein